MPASGDWDTMDTTDPGRVMAESSIRDIDEAEGRDLLKLGRVGRVGWVKADGVLQLLVVNYIFDGEHVYFRTTAGSDLSELVEPTSVAFEADHIEEIYQTGWSVTAHGTSASVSEAEAIGLAMQPTPWAPGERSIFVSISVDQIAGRKVRGAM
jgi:uncharacterized protein